MKPLTIDDIDETEPTPDWSPSLRRLRTKPINELTHEEMRLALVNRWALTSLIPLALDILEKEPATGYGTGGMSLLSGVLGASAAVRIVHPNWWVRARNILTREIHAQSKLPPAEFSAVARAEEAELREQLASRYLTNIAADERPL